MEIIGNGGLVRTDNIKLNPAMNVSSLICRKVHLTIFGNLLHLQKLRSSFGWILLTDFIIKKCYKKRVYSLWICITCYFLREMRPEIISFLDDLI